MITLLFVIISIVFILSLGLGVTTLVLSRSSPEIARDSTAQPATAIPAPTFRWRDIILPPFVLILSVALVAYFYHLLPVDVAYHFQADGSPDEWTGRSTITLWALLPQLFLTTLALVVVWGITRLSSLFRQAEGIGVNLNRVASIMGNMTALPQVILFFAMLDIFSYNAYQVRVIPLWVFALIVMALGALILGIFFIRTIRQVRSNQ